MIGLSTVKRASKSGVKAVRVFACGLKRRRSTTLTTIVQFGRVLAQEFDRGQGLEPSARRRSRPSPRPLGAVVVACPWPDAQPRLAVLDRLVHGQPGGDGVCGDDHMASSISRRSS